ncbi:MAG TPA: type VI secretion system baseplate subunit TssF, partial [Alphaproteobacteria bacterium]|nr:type VI secretion system baseplate subunit TssF [Alphaproteobacteria bacterium]
MSREHFEQMLDYYQQEMIYLRRSGSLFADQYPKIAQNLNLSAAGSADPHVQRLLESFAFLTGRLQKELDNRYIQFTNTLLGVLYPQFLSPFPAASIASFRLSPHLGKSTSGYSVPRGTSLFTEAQENKTCRFQTTYPVELWPFEVSEASVMNMDQSPLTASHFQTQWVLKIRVQRYDGKMSELDPSFLRFYLAGDAFTAQCLYDSILGYLPEEPTPVYIQADTEDSLTQLPEGSIVPIGFKNDESLIPYPHKTLDAYRLLHEYFVFPEKFNFLDIQNFSTANANQYVDIYIPLADRSRADKFRINESNFILGCTPIINLFPKISEPIDLNHQSVSYRLVGDQRNEDSTEIHSILKVVAAVGGGKETEVFAPYFSFDYEVEERNNGLFWHSSRSPSENPNISGTEVYLSFVDYNFTPQNPSDQTVYAYTMCTNRDLASYVPAGGALQVDGTIPPATITCLERPTPEIQPSLDGEAQWRLISQLSINHLSLSGNDKAVLVLKELLHLYSGFNKNKSHPEINAIENISYKPVIRRWGVDAWRGFVQGISITLT